MLNEEQVRDAIVEGYRRMMSNWIARARLSAEEQKIFQAVANAVATNPAALDGVYTCYKNLP